MGASVQSFQVEFGNSSFLRRVSEKGEFLLPGGAPENEVFDFLQEVLSQARQPENSQHIVSRGLVQERDFLNQGVVARKYARGGLVASVNADTFFKLPNVPLTASRPFMEFLVLGSLFERGISVPAPYALLVEEVFWGFAYRAVIATCKIDGARDFLNLDASEQEELSRLAGLEAKRMLENCVFHSDLHVGNVLASRSHGLTATLIDFDKAKFIDPAKEKQPYARALVERWQRSVKKRNLAPVISSAFAAGLEGV